MENIDANFRKLLDQRLLANEGGGYEAEIIYSEKFKSAYSSVRRYTRFESAVNCTLDTVRLNKTRAKAAFIKMLCGKEGWKQIDKYQFVVDPAKPYDFLTEKQVDRKELLDSLDNRPKNTGFGHLETAEKIGMTRPY